MDNYRLFCFIFYRLCRYRGLLTSDMKPFLTFITTDGIVLLLHQSFTLATLSSLLLAARILVSSGGETECRCLGNCTRVFGFLLWWRVSLERHSIFLGVGTVAVLTLWPGQTRLYCAGSRCFCSSLYSLFALLLLGISHSNPLRAL